MSSSIPYRNSPPRTLSQTTLSTQFSSASSSQQPSPRLATTPSSATSSSSQQPTRSYFKYESVDESSLPSSYAASSTTTLSNSSSCVAVANTSTGLSSNFLHPAHPLHSHYYYHFIKGCDHNAFSIENVFNNNNFLSKILLRF